MTQPTNTSTNTSTNQTEGKTIRVTLVKSAIGYKQDQKDTVRSLGLTRMNKTVEVKDNPAIRGMIAKVSHLVRVEE